MPVFVAEAQVIKMPRVDFKLPSVLETAKQTTSRYTKDNEKGPNYIIMESHQTTREEIKRRNRVAI